MNYCKPLLLFFAIIFSSGCLPLKNKKEGLYRIIPEKRSDIRSLDIAHTFLWAVFGNEDDGIYGEGIHARYKPEWENNSLKALRWWLRNPFHNFCFYVIGSADKVNSRLVLIDKSPFFLAFHGGKPFIQICYYGTYYAGWRERGNFGIKMNFRPQNDR
jgi:hypothetical protein